MERELLIDLVKEQGIADLILDYRNSIDAVERFQPVLEELKMMTPVNEFNDFIFECSPVTSQKLAIKWAKNNKTQFGVFRNAFNVVRGLWGIAWATV